MKILETDGKGRVLLSSTHEDDVPHGLSEMLVWTEAESEGHVRWLVKEGIDRLADLEDAGIDWEDAEDD